MSRRNDNPSLYHQKAAEFSTTASGPRVERAYGPCFLVICDDKPEWAMPYNILAYAYPDEDQIRDVAERTVLQFMSSYRRPFHWELPEIEPESDDPLRGGSALAEAKRRILDDPADSAGKRFLLAGRKLGQTFNLPKEPWRKRYATGLDLERLDTEPLPLASLGTDVCPGVDIPLDDRRF